MVISVDAPPCHPSSRLARCASLARRWLPNCLCCLFAFALVSAVLLGRGAASWGEPGIERKREQFQAAKDRYDVLFFGSSHIYRGIIPSQFDREMVAFGHPTCSFNFAFAGMEPHEVDAVLDETLEARPARLRFVFVEVSHWNPVIREENRYTKRAVAWHTLGETWSALHSCSLAPVPRKERLELARVHLLHMAARYTNLGDGTRAIRGDRVGGGDHSAPDDEGFLALDEEPNPAVAERHRLFLRNVQDYRDMVARLKEGPSPGGSEARFNRAALAGQAARIRAGGAAPIYVLPPQFNRKPELECLQEEGVVPTLLNFNDPVRFPTLFRDELHWDSDHFNRAGAEEWTRLLARQFAALLAEDGRLCDRGQGSDRR
jgi:hypothetical protein